MLGFSKFIGATLVIATGMYAGSVRSEPVSQKKDSLKGAIHEKKKELLKKFKQKKAKFLDKWSLSSLEREEATLYLAQLLVKCEEGSIEGLKEACVFFDTNNISCLPEAIIACLNDLNTASYHETIGFSLCGKYIGDDGLEYDDGKADEVMEQLSFYSLPIHHWEKKVIEKIITSMAEKSLAQLLLDRKEMEKRGDQVNHVHPLRFLSCIFSDSYLKSCVQQFKGQTFKWSSFIDGYAQRMREEAAKNNLSQHIEGFCEFLKLDIEIVSEIIQKGNFEGLILHLLQV